MELIKKTLIIIIIVISVTNVISQNIVINEFMSKNDTCIQDKDGDYSDWIELYNPTNTPINLLNYRLSDDYNDFNKWVFPNITILPNSYLLVYASGKNILDPSELHTNFKIASSGEEIYLANNLGVLIDKTISINLYSDQSYCRMPDGSLNWILSKLPSPNYSNNDYSQLVFSHKEGLYTSPFSLEVYSLLGDTIYYTLNGDIPTVNSNIFSDSLIIDYVSNHPNTISEIPTTPPQNLIGYKAWESPSSLVPKATILRCASFKNGVRSSDIFSKTFIVNKEIINKYQVPIISLITEAGNLFDSLYGIYVPGICYDSNNVDWAGNYFMHGDYWERDVHIEYFENDGSLCFSQDAGIRIHGGQTRQAAQKSLRLYARSEYGKNEFNHRLFHNKKEDSYKRFILRSTMGTWYEQAMISDDVAQNIASQLDIDHQDFQVVIVFINGEYWGIHTIKDRIDERYIEYTHGIDHNLVEFNDDNSEDYNNLLDFVNNNDLSFINNYEYVKTKIDIDNYIDYNIAEMFFNNYDWPANNYKLWREIPNGKWRWVFYDLDAGFQDENYNMFHHNTLIDSTVYWPNPPHSTLLFRSLIKNNEFKMKFINRYAEILNKDFNYILMTNKFDSISSLYDDLLINHIERWNYPNSIDSWSNGINNVILDFIRKRPCIVSDQIMDFFNLTSFDFNCNINTDESNDLILAPNPNHGNFFIFSRVFDIIDATLIITNINGQVVYYEENVDLMQYEKKKFDLSYLSDNTYIMRITSKDHSLQKMIVVL